ncbi:MAG: response regulator transcription factor, partial [Chloroflexi bacterium]|nr:response regulator transcription factor [Chloroflexota bacterium]
MKRRQVLIADDLPQTRDGLQALLSILPEIEIVAEAADGREAVRLVQAVRPDVVLMDVCMPDMDGLDATQIIKSSWPETKVIVLTIHADYQTEALAAGADAFFVKGASTEKLLEAV